jgi:hypothetical protein
MKSEIIFETERLYARVWHIDADAAGAFSMYGDPEMVRHIGGKLVASLDEQREMLAMVLEHFELAADEWKCAQRT